MAPTTNCSLSLNTPLDTPLPAIEFNPKPRVESGSVPNRPSIISSSRPSSTRNVQLTPFAGYTQPPDPRLNINPYGTMSYNTVLGRGINKNSMQGTRNPNERDEQDFFSFARCLEQDLRPRWPLKPFHDHKDKLAKKKTKAELKQGMQEYKAKLRRRNPYLDEDRIHKHGYRYILEVYIRDMFRDWNDGQVKSAVHRKFGETMRVNDIQKRIKAERQRIRVEREGVRGFVGNAGAGIGDVGDRDGLAERIEAIKRERSAAQPGGSLGRAAVIRSAIQAYQTNGVSRAAVAEPSATQQLPPISVGGQTTQVQHTTPAQIARNREQIVRSLRRKMQLNQQKINRRPHRTQQIQPDLQHMQRHYCAVPPLPGKVSSVQDYVELANRRRAAEGRGRSVQFLGEARVGGEGEGTPTALNLEAALRRGSSRVSAVRGSEYHGQGRTTEKQAQVQQRRNSQTGEESGFRSQRQPSTENPTEAQQPERTSRKRSIDGSTVLQQSSKLQREGNLSSPRVQVRPQFAHQGSGQAAKESGNQAPQQRPTLTQSNLRLPGSSVNGTAQQQSAVPTDVQQRLQEYTARIRNQQRNQQLAQNGVGVQNLQTQFPSEQSQDRQATVSTSPVQRAPTFPQKDARRVSVNSSPVQHRQLVQNKGLNCSAQQIQGQPGPRSNMPLHSSPVEQQLLPQQQTMQRRHSQNGYVVEIPTQLHVLQQSSPVQPQQFLPQHHAMQRHNIQNGYGNLIPSPQQHAQPQLQQNAQITALQASPIQQIPLQSFQQPIHQQQFPVQPPSHNHNQNMIGYQLPAQASGQRVFYPQAQPQPQLQPQSHQNAQNAQNAKNMAMNGSQFQQQVLPPQKIKSPEQVLYEQQSFAVQQHQHQQQHPQPQPHYQHQQIPGGQNVNGGVNGGGGGHAMLTPGFYTPQQQQQPIQNPHQQNRNLWQNQQY